MSLCLRLIEDRLEFTRQVGFASHLQRHGFEGYTFERVQRACLGILSVAPHPPSPTTHAHHRHTATSQKGTAIFLFVRACVCLADDGEAALSGTTWWRMRAT